MIIYLIRHGITPGNLEKRYVGRTDEALAEEGVRQLLSLRSMIPRTGNALFVSPMKRCRQTAEILFPGLNQQVADDLRECDFGVFEYRNYIEMKNDPAYCAWVDGGGRDPFPDGEHPADFRQRSVEGFLRAVKEAALAGKNNVIFVVHGGTIMAVMEALAQPERNYYDWQLPNGAGVVCEYEPRRERCLTFLRFIPEHQESRSELETAGTET